MRIIRLKCPPAAASGGLAGLDDKDDEDDEMEKVERPDDRPSVSPNKPRIIVSQGCEIGDAVCPPRRRRPGGPKGIYTIVD